MVFEQNCWGKRRLWAKQWLLNSEFKVWYVLSVCQTSEKRKNEDWDSERKWNSTSKMIKYQQISNASERKKFPWTDGGFFNLWSNKGSNNSNKVKSYPGLLINQRGLWRREKRLEIFGGKITSTSRRAAEVAKANSTFLDIQKNHWTETPNPNLSFNIKMIYCQYLLISICVIHCNMEEKGKYAKKKKKKEDKTGKKKKGKEGKTSHNCKKLPSSFISNCDRNILKAEGQFKMFPGVSNKNLGNSNLDFNLQLILLMVTLGKCPSLQGSKKKIRITICFQLLYFLFHQQITVLRSQHLKHSLKKEKNQTKAPDRELWHTHYS